MITISAKELRLRLSEMLQRAMNGEEIEVIYRSRPAVFLTAAKKNAYAYTGDQVEKRLAKAIEHLPGNAPSMLRDPGKTYKRLRDELYRKDPKYRDYLKP